MEDEFLLALGGTFDVPPELLAAWRREGLMRELRRALWRLYLRRMWDDILRRYGLL